MMCTPHNRDADETLELAICEVCEEDCSASEAESNRRDYGVAICDACVEGGFECGALPLGGPGREVNLMFDAVDDARLAL